jgi:Arc/MetJ-type ribon-helix-helix transcriptional regulator
MSKLEPIDEFVREQLASGRFSDYDALVRYALASLKHRQSEIDEVAQELRPAVESMQRGEPGLIVDFENIKQAGRKRLALTGSSK